MRFLVIDRDLTSSSMLVLAMWAAVQIIYMALGQKSHLTVKYCSGREVKYLYEIPKIFFSQMLWLQCL